MNTGRVLVGLVLLLQPAVLRPQPQESPALTAAKLVARFGTLCTAQSFASAEGRRAQVNDAGAGPRTGKGPGGEDDVDYLLNHDKLSEAQNLMAEGQWEQATSLLCEALHYRYTSFGMSDIRTLAAVNDFGVLLRKSGRGSEARAMLEDCILFANGLRLSGNELLDRPLIRARFNMRLNLAASLYEQGYYAASVEILEGLVVAKLDNRALDADNRMVAATNLGLALGALGRSGEAETYLRDALSSRMEEDPVGQGVPASMTNLGANLSAQGKYAEGERLLRRGRQLRAGMFGVDHLNTAFSDMHLASNLIGQGRFAEALPFAQEAYATGRSQLPALHPDRVIALSVLGNAKLGLGDFKGALEAAREASNAQLSHSTLESGQAKQSPLISPLRRYQDPQRLLVRSGWESLAVGPRQWQAGHVPDIVDEAFVAGQRLVWSSTGDAIAHAAARRVANEQGLGELAGRIERLRDRVEQLDSGVTAAAGSMSASGRASLSPLREQREKANQQLNDLATELRTRFPAFFAYLNPEPVRLGDLQKLTKPGEVVIFLAPGEGPEQGFVWAVTRDRVGWAEIHLSGDAFVRMVRRLRLVIDPRGARSPISSGNPEMAAGARGYDRQGAFELYRHLFGDPAIAPLVEAASTWLVVPQREAVGLPLAALVTRAPADGPDGNVAPAGLRRTHWLAFEHELSLLPTVSSIALLRAPRGAHAAIRLPFFGLGDPSFQGDSDSPQDANAYFSDGEVRLAELRKLRPLPGTKTEIETLARTLGGGPGDILLGSDASETKLRRLAAERGLNRYATLAFATHGLVTGNLANTLVEPALALTPPTVATRSDDGLLTASEASLLRLDADWVLLSACNSAAGGASNAEGLTGLARAFLLAGARAVLVSHWRVRDDAAPRITGRTIALMHVDGLTRGKALQQAMRELMMDNSLDATGSSFAAPSAWAAFALVGLD